MKILFFLLFFIHIQAFTNTKPLAWKIATERIRDSGTGFFISPNYFVTNFHVLASLIQSVSSLKDIHIIHNDRTFYRVEKIVSISALYDLAILRTNQPVDFHLKTAKGPLHSHQPLTIVGYPRGQLEVIRQIGEIIFDKNQGVSMPFNISSTLKGASGAPFINSRGEVVGIVSETFFNTLYSPITIDQLNAVKEGRYSVNRCNNCHPQEWINQALRQLTRLANTGNKVAQYKLGLYYFEGVFVKRSIPKAKRWLRRAAKKGHLYAQNKLGNILLAENMNSEEGYRLVMQAMEGNLTPAMFLFDRFIVEFKENSFVGSHWKIIHDELSKKLSERNFYIPNGGLSINPRSNLCRFTFSSF